MLTLWRPERELARLSRDFDSWFGHLDGPRGGAAFTPAVDIEETQEAVILHADLPGLEKKNIDIRVDGDQLIISGTRQTNEEAKLEGGFRRERRFGKFVRRFTLGDQVNGAEIDARYENGVLSVTLPKKEEAKPRQIQVDVH